MNHIERLERVRAKAEGKRVKRMAKLEKRRRTARGVSEFLRKSKATHMSRIIPEKRTLRQGLRDLAVLVAKKITRRGVR